MRFLSRQIKSVKSLNAHTLSRVYLYNIGAHTVIGCAVGISELGFGSKSQSIDSDVMPVLIQGLSGAGKGFLMGIVAPIAYPVFLFNWSLGA